MLPAPSSLRTFLVGTLEATYFTAVLLGGNAADGFREGRVGVVGGEWEFSSFSVTENVTSIL